MSSVVVGASEPGLRKLRRRPDCSQQGSSALFKNVRCSFVTRDTVPGRSRPGHSLKKRRPFMRLSFGTKSNFTQDPRSRPDSPSSIRRFNDSPLPAGAGGAPAGSPLGPRKRQGGHKPWNRNQSDFHRKAVRGRRFLLTARPISYRWLTDNTRTLYTVSTVKYGCVLL